MNVPLLLEMAAGGHGDRVAVTAPEGSMTVAELAELASEAAERYRARGATHVAHLGTFGLAVPTALFGAGLAGVPYVPLNYRLAPDRVAALLAPLEPLVLVGGDGSEEMRGSGPSTESPGSPAPGGDDAAILLHTSGTTAAPKAAVLRHRHLFAYVIGTVEFGSADAAEATLVSVPPYHVAGLAAVLTSVYVGRRIVLQPQFEPAAWLDTADREAVTHAFVVPTMLARIVEHCEVSGRSAPLIRHLAYGGGRMPASVIHRALRLFPETNFVNAYGLTETSSTLAVLGPDDHHAARNGDETALAHLNSVGLPLPTVEVEIRDDDGRSVPVGDAGEIWVRGDQVSGEYRGLDAAVDEVGWFATRDRGHVDGDGYLFVEGRLDDTIIRGGENIAPAEIEDVLLGHPGVADVAVVGVPDDEWGAITVAVVVTREGHEVTGDELREWVRARLRSSRTPDRVEFRDELPYTDTGKVLRRRLREELVGG